MELINLATSLEKIILVLEVIVLVFLVAMILKR